MGPHSAIEFADKNRRMMPIMTLQSDFIKAPPFPLWFPRAGSQRLSFSACSAYPEDSVNFDQSGIHDKK
jgi:hypothetical protein